MQDERGKKLVGSSHSLIKVLSSHIYGLKVLKATKSLHVCLVQVQIFERAKTRSQFYSFTATPACSITPMMITVVVSATTYARTVNLLITLTVKSETIHTIIST
jgi:hypothetical protein